MPRVQNITTGEVREVQNNSQDLADLGFVPVGADTPLQLASITGQNNQPSQGTAETIRTDNSILDNLGQQVENFTQETATSPDLSSALSGLLTQRDELKTITQSELDAINQEGSAAGSEYDALIADAQEAKRFGLPKAIVGAGERGGFMNTQFAGAAALTPIQGGGFVGAGGELERIKSVYDNNIQKVRIAKQQAIDTAKIAARKAILSGKKDDFNTAVSLYELARQSHQDALDLQSKKINALTAYQQERRAGVKSTYDIIKDIPEGQTVTIEGQTFTGIAVPDATKAFFSGSDIVSLMKALPEGSLQTITDPNTGTEYTIAGLSKEQPDYLTATDDRGNVTFVDKNTLEPVKTVMGIGKTKTQAANVTLNMNNAEKNDLSEALATLEATRGEKYNSSEVAKQYRIYNQLHPGKGDQLLEAIKAEVNYNDQPIKELYDVKQESTDAMEVTLPSGATIKF